MKHKLLIVVLSAFLASCGGEQYQDIKSWMKEEEAKMPRKIPDLPQVQILKPSPFEAEGFDPFKIKKVVIPDVNKLKISPDLNRKREFLEAYSLDNLEMVGILERNKDKKIYALLKTIDGLLHPVHVGNYVGQNYGKITKIEEGGLTVLELVQDGTGEWIERINELYLKESPQTAGSSKSAKKGK